MKRTCSSIELSSVSDLIASDGMLSSPVPLLLFIYLTVVVISFIVNGLIAARKSVCAASMSSVFSASGLFMSFSNCSNHLFRCS